MNETNHTHIWYIMDQWMPMIWAHYLLIRVKVYSRKRRNPKPKLKEKLWSKLASWCINGFLGKWDFSIESTYYHLRKMWRLMFRTLYYICCTKLQKDLVLWIGTTQGNCHVVSEVGTFQCLCIYCNEPNHCHFDYTKYKNLSKLWNA